MNDLILKGGRVVDPAQGLDKVTDIAFSGGKVAAIGDNLQGKDIRPVAGKIVVPGLIDLHTHVYWGGTSLGVEAELLARTGGDAFDCALPPDGKSLRVPSIVAAFARIVRYRIDKLGALADQEGKSPVLDALFATKEPKTGTDGTMSWTADVYNPSSEDDFVLMQLKYLEDSSLVTDSIGHRGLFRINATQWPHVF